MAAQIGRMLAELDVRSLHVVAMAQSEDGYEATRERLILEMNAETPEHPLEQQLDKSGLDELRNM